jgi:ATPase subunit of ABC transporter with duplicated ATPase domains
LSNFSNSGNAEIQKKYKEVDRMGKTKFKKIQKLSKGENNKLKLKKIVFEQFF